MKSLKQITKQPETRKLRLAKLRDELRELEDELRMYADTTEDATQDLEACVETLSQYV